MKNIDLIKVILVALIATPFIAYFYISGFSFCWNFIH